MISGVGGRGGRIDVTTPPDSWYTAPQLPGASERQHARLKVTPGSGCLLMGVCMHVLPVASLRTTGALTHTPAGISSIQPLEWACEWAPGRSSARCSMQHLSTSTPYPSNPRVREWAAAATGS